MARHRIELRVVGSFDDSVDYDATRSLGQTPEPCTVLVLLDRGDYLRIDKAYLDVAITLTADRVRKPRKK